MQAFAERKYSYTPDEETCSASITAFMNAGLAMPGRCQAVAGNFLDALFCR